MTRGSALSQVVLLSIVGCFGEPPEVESSGPDSTTGSTTGDADPSSADALGSSESSVTSSSGSTSEAGPTSDPSSGSAEATSSTTGENADFALRFDGEGSVVSTGPIVWSSSNFTVEAWIEILSDGAAGVIVDQQDATLTAGWVLHLHPESGSLLFSIYDAVGSPYTVQGPSVSAIGAGWHHIAGVHADDMLALFVDGVQVADVSAVASMSVTANPIALGAHNTKQDAMWRLREVAIDDVRVVARALYEKSFDPPLRFDDVGDVVVLLRLDEGMGATTEDPVTGAEFTVTNATWVPGAP